MPDDSAESAKRVLEPNERISDLTAYVFDPGDSDRTVVIGVGLSPRPF